MESFDRISKIFHSNFSGIVSWKNLPLEMFNCIHTHSFIQRIKYLLHGSKSDPSLRSYHHWSKVIDYKYSNFSLKSCAKRRNSTLLKRVNLPCQNKPNSIEKIFDMMAKPWSCVSMKLLFLSPPPSPFLHSYKGSYSPRWQPL